MQGIALSQYLLKLDPSAFARATQAPFLRAAGAGDLSKSTLSRWLSQDRLYAQTYIRFASLLLSKINLPTTRHLSGSRPPVSSLLVDCIIGALNNVRRELRFFETVAEEYGLDLNHPWDESAPRFGPTPITRAYGDLFMSCAAPGTPVLHGMVALYGTEICYLTSWLYAKGVSGETSKDNDNGNDQSAFKKDQDGGALRTEFIPNWTNNEFQDFVDEIGSLMDKLAEKIGAEELRGCEEVWRQVLWIEERFWPEI
ncbi:MAG: hypothetical protein M1834_002360 [Cirrosporium novae-zelandiae]|nr:MAG: hypothetical protein M1834_002360 [Cirrosporium novae-zelandiae]